MVIVIVHTNLGNDEIESIEQSLLHPTDEILFDVVRAFKGGYVSGTRQLTLVNRSMVFEQDTDGDPDRD